MLLSFASEQSSNGSSVAFICLENENNVLLNTHVRMKPRMEIQLLVVKC